MNVRYVLVLLKSWSSNQDLKRTLLLPPSFFGTFDGGGGGVFGGTIRLLHDVVPSGLHGGSSAVSKLRKPEISIKVEEGTIPKE
jgi:hypothetical protein